ncbi:allantoicase, partial [Streptomyces sp. NPDC000405]
PPGARSRTGRCAGRGAPAGRRRDQGHDWIRYRLAARSAVRAVEIDTACLKGNSAGWASVSVRDGAGGAWTEILPRTGLQPDTNHRFVLPEPAVGTHARVDIYPDGGISRLRLYGSLTDAGAARLAARHQELSG